MKEIVGNHEYKEPYTINSAQSSLKSHFLWVTLYNQAVYTGWVWGMGDMDSGGEQGFIVDLGSAKQKVVNNLLRVFKDILSRVSNASGFYYAQLQTL